MKIERYLIAVVIFIIMVYSFESCPSKSVTPAKEILMNTPTVTPTAKIKSTPTPTLAATPDINDYTLARRLACTETIMMVEHGYWKLDCKVICEQLKKGVDFKNMLSCKEELNATIILKHCECAKEVLNEKK